MSNEATEEFLKHISQKASQLEDFIEEEPVLLLSHYDADGLTAASVLVHLLIEKNAVFHLKIIEQPSAEDLEKVVSECKHYNSIILCDMGSRHGSLLSNFSQKYSKKIAVIDHHTPPQETPETTKFFLEVNPWRHGVNGSLHVSSSGLAYLMVKELDSKISEKVVHLALIGALGDRQDQGERCDFLGVNKLILNEAIEKKIVSREIGLRLFGIRRRPLYKCLEYTIDPFIPGLSGDEKACIEFLRSISIEPFFSDGRPKMINDLSEGEVRKLVIELVKYMISEGVPPQEAEKLLGYSYFINSFYKYPELYDAREFAVLLNACGRLNEEWVGLMICLNKIDYYEQVISVLTKYRKTLKEVLNMVENKEIPINYLSKTIVVDCIGIVNERLSGALSSIISTKPDFRAYKVLALLASSSKPKHVKISLRVLREIPGFSLGATISKIAKDIGGEAGGHEKAAGATLLEEKVNLFLRKLEKEIP